MAIRTGHGGSVFNFDVPITIPTGRWSGNWRVRPAEVTQSNSGGGTRYKPVVQDPSWTCEFARDDDFFMEALGLTKGTEISALYFKLGAANQYDLLENTLVVEVSKVCDNAGDVVRISVSGQGGVVTEDTTN